MVVANASADSHAVPRGWPGNTAGTLRLKRRARRGASASLAVVSRFISPSTCAGMPSISSCARIRPCGPRPTSGCGDGAAARRRPGRARRQQRRRGRRRGIAPGMPAGSPLLRAGAPPAAISRPAAPGAVTRLDSSRPHTLHLDNELATGPTRWPAILDSSVAASKVSIWQRASRRVVRLGPAARF